MVNVNKVFFKSVCSPCKGEEFVKEKCEDVESDVPSIYLEWVIDKSKCNFKISF